MVTEEGIITAVTSSTAWVKTVRSSSCEACEARDSCQEGNHTKEMTVQVDNLINAGIGDRVAIGFRTGPLLKLTFMLYVFPIILLIIGAALGQAAAPILHTDQSLTSIFTGIGCFAVAFLIIRKLNDKLASQKKYMPFLLRIVQKNPPVKEK
jgi:sigma-E factor negative regulatory protein RseC